MSAISGGSLKPELLMAAQATTSNMTSTAITTTTPTLTASSITGNIVPTATPEVDEEEFSAKPPDHSWNKNGSPQKSNCYQLLFHNFPLLHAYILFR